MLRDQFNFIPLHEVMEELGVSRSTVDRWRKHKQLPSIKIGKEIYFDRNELLRWYKQFGQDRYTVSPAAMPASGETLTIGYTTVSAHMWGPLIIKEFGLLEQELKRIRPKDRIDIRWHRAKDGMELVKGIIAGAIQIATFGDYALSVSHMIGRLLPDFRPVLLAAGGKSAGGGGFALVVPAGMALQHISELATLPIATTFRTNAEYRVRKMLESHQLPELNIVHRSIADSMESLRKGRLSASIMWEPYLSLVQHEKIGQPIFHRELGLGFIAGVAADESWVQAHEDVTIAYLKAHLLASRLIREQPDRAADVFAKETGFPAEAIGRSITNIRWDASVYRNDLEMINHFDPTLFWGRADAQKDKVDIRCNTRYLSIAAQSLKLPALPPTLLEGDWQRTQW